MKKKLLIFALFGVIVSCTPEVLNTTDEIQACCGDEGEIPPPPPPPPPTEDGFGG